MTLSKSTAASIVIALRDDALQRASSPKLFERGKTYAASGAVQLAKMPSSTVDAVTATVHGTEDYEVAVSIGDNEQLKGRCNCLSAQDGWFCKHQVAVALVWRDVLQGNKPTVDERARSKVAASVKRAQTVESKARALREFLLGCDSKLLAEKLLEIAEYDRHVARELEQWRKRAIAGTKPAELKPLITELLSTGRGFIGWRESFAFARQAEPVLHLLQKARAEFPANSVALCAHALRRAWKALEGADDSNGDIGDLCRQIGAEWVAALKQAGPQPASYGDEYLRMQLDDPFGCFDDTTAEDAIGPAALARYRAALGESWERTRAIVKTEEASDSARGRARYAFSTSEAALALMRLERLHLTQLEAQGDLDSVLSIMRADAHRPYDCVRVVQFLVKHKRFREALNESERANKKFPDDAQVQHVLLECYERDGWSEEAFALRRRLHDEHPTVESFHALLKAAAAYAKDVPKLRQELLDTIAAEELREQRLPALRRLNRTLELSATRCRDVSLRAAILCSEKQWEIAADLIQPPNICETSLVQTIAMHLPASQGEQALLLLLRVFDSLMPQAGTPYREELALVKEIAERMDAPTRERWVAQLRTSYKAKRNFIAGLPS